ncbi:MAG: [citrate (pro-3S)-lyase] ligase [Lactobacillus sp.]|uniref:[Citrate [pro-3S]-lyase] ligase n=1 Tax=Bombilactobacillus bombi TaxID=1303590 RepID=A0A3R6XRF5_9LACO|nr:[citrate (pro-3S)-lyase] ligase [Bombilactobacillus bombi]MCO6543409.1 [citrate (pro-3S)-lyase] ligase [Lactobacillus sp.]RHW45612.1 [citrate (pro-3S)-lyase] ligase [Bombilactobacillus bombi]
MAIVELNLQLSDVKNSWQQFLEERGINNFSPAEVQQLDLTLGLYEDNQLVATASAAHNVIKYVGVCQLDSTPGARFNQIISELTSRLYQRQIFHLFVFTKIQYSSSFQHVGFHELAHSHQAAFLETGTPDIHDYLDQLPQVKSLPTQKIGGIVMNANPFTSGHRYLVEQALQQCDYVYVFVVNTDASLFSTAERLQLVQAGLQDLPHAIVVSGGDYMVSYATFPAYFLKSDQNTTEYQTTLDAHIFRDLIAPACQITLRFVGTEPLSPTTAIYNRVLAEELPPQVTLKVIERKQDQQQKVISASAVRQMIAQNNLKELKSLVPISTYQFIKDNLKQLQVRIQKGMKINGN